MRNTIIFLQDLLAGVSGIRLTHMPLQKPAILAFLQAQTDHKFDPVLQENHDFWQQLLLSPMQNSGYELILPDRSVFLFYPHKATASVLCLHAAQPNPSLQASTLRRAGDLIWEYLLAEPWGIPPAPHYSIPDVPAIHTSFASGEDISQMRQVEMRYEYSAALTDAIGQGNSSLALHLIGQYNPNVQTTVRNTNPLRNAQNYCIVMNTQLRHTLEKSGIHPYQVDKLSNEVGIEIEQLKSTNQLPEFFSRVIHRYCRLVQEHAYPNLKPLTNLAVTYIKEHLADNLTVKDTAKALTVNANYLSSLFHRDMGITFIDFVNKERTNQAAALLQHTNLQIQQIASAVGYNNTSYFAKQFVRFQGVSPSHYRREV